MPAALRRSPGPGLAVVVALVLGAGRAGAQALPTVELQPFPGQPVRGLRAAELQRFEQGRLAFEQLLGVADGLGPIYNDNGCAKCHAHPMPGGFSSSAATRFGKAASGPNPFDPLDELGGSLLQDQAIDLACVETLPGEADVTALRTTTHVFGSGLVEAIPDAVLLDLQDHPPRTGVAGLAHMVTPLEGGGPRVGRFGWKAQVATLLSFSAEASVNEMGLTNRLIASENAPNGDLALLAACDGVADPEDGPDSEGFDLIDRQTDYQRLLAPPPQTPRAGMAGEVLFGQLGCGACHVSTFTSGVVAEAALSRVSFRPFSDFLLHAVNGDGIVQGMADETRLRTAPLWGLAQRAGTGLLHDGAATGGTAEQNIHAAILAHDGEAGFATAAYAALGGVQRDQLIAFLMSLGTAEFDIERNNTVDEIDWFFLSFAGHFTGPDPSGVGFFGPDDEAAVADVDQDGDFDLVDFGYMQRAFTGSDP